MAKTMLNSQRNFVEYLEQVNALVKEAGFDKSKDTLIKSIQERELLVPVVGGFSAGKSTAINAFLGEDILSVAITPETALATELRYTQEASYAEAVKENGQAERIELDKFSTLKDRASEFQFVRLYLNNPKLEQIKPLILVDMPGFDAPLEAHNKAIMEYLARGVYFIIVESVKKGTLAMSIKRHIENLQALGRSFSFALTKCDSEPKSKVDEVKMSVADELKDSFDYDKSVFLLDLNGGLDEVIKDANPEQIFENLYKDELKFDFKDTKSSLQTKISALKADKNEALEAVKELEKAVDKIKSAQEKLNTDTNERAQKAGVVTINAVVDMLRLRMNEVADAALSGKEAMGSVINEIVQNVLLREFNEKTASQRKYLLDAFTEEVKYLNLDSFHLNKEWVNDIGASINNALTDINIKVDDNFVKKFGKELLLVAQELIKRLSALLSKLPILLKLQPLLLGLAKYLPDIINYFKGKIVDEKELAAQILPKIKESLQDEVLNAFKDNFKATQEAIALLLEAKFKEKQTEINAAQEQKAQILGELDDKIQALNGVSGELDSLANKYLYA